MLFRSVVLIVAVLRVAVELPIVLGNVDLVEEYLLSTYSKSEPSRVVRLDGQVRAAIG